MNSEQYKRVEELFETLRGVPLVRAKKRLEELCPDDQEVREETLSLLRNATPSGLEAPTADLVAGVQDAAGGLGPAAASLGGEQIGRYRVLTPLGQGGMGAVYLAEQSEPFQREVALKVIKLGMDTEEVVARFEAERQALAIMEHPGIARVYDAGATPSGRPYFAMELVRGAPLTSYCDAHRLNLHERLAMFAQVCDAVHHAHQKGLIHRDLKPSNVLVAEVDGVPTPKIIDFGVSKAIGQSLTAATLHTQAGQIIGTPQYMSPEQVAASPDVDTRSDIYALGVILYELMTGALPYEESTLDSGSLIALVKQIRELEPPRPSTRLAALDHAEQIAARRGADLPSLKRQLRDDIDWIIAKALEKDRTRRYSSAAELRQDIEAHLRHEPVTAGPPTAGYRMRKFYRRHPLGVPAAAAASLLVIAGLAGTTWQAVRATRAEGEARALAVREAEARQEAESALEEARRARAAEAHQREVAEQEASVATAINRFLQDMLTSNDPNVARGREVTVREVLDKAADGVANRFEGQPAVRASVHHTIGTSYSSLAAFDEAAFHLERAIEESEARGVPDDPDAAASRSMLGAIRVAQGRLAEAERLLTLALAQQEQVNPAGRSTILTLSRLAPLRIAQGDFMRAESRLRELLGRADAPAETTDAAVLLQARAHLTRVVMAQGRFEEGLEVARAAIPDALAVLGRDHTVTAHLYGQAAWGAASLGLNQEADDHYQASLDIRERILGERHPDTLVIMGSYAWFLRNQSGRAQDALRVNTRVLRLQEEAVGEGAPTTLLSLYRQAAILGDLGRHEEAVEFAEECVARHERVYGPEHPRTADALGILAGRFWSRDPDRAAGLYRRALEIRSSALGAGHPDTVSARMNLGLALSQTERVDEAERILRDAAAQLEERFGLRHDRTIAAYMNLSLVLGRQERYDEMLELLEPLVTSPSEGADDFGIHINYAFALLNSGRVEEALRQYEELDVRAAQRFPANHVNRMTVRAGLGRCLHALDRIDEAEEALTAACSHPRAAEFQDDPMMRGAFEALIDIHERRHKADPDAGHDAEAARWRSIAETPTAGAGGS